MKPFAGRPAIRWKFFTAPTLLILLVSLIAAGCVGPAKTLREAQDQFNTAAALENQVKLNPLQEDTLVTISRAREGYRQALLLVSPLIEEKQNALAQDNLLGSAYTLKALTLWRLGDYDQTLETLQAANAKPVTDSLYPRDRAVMDAMRGLIKNDQAYRKMTDRGPDGAPTGAYGDIHTLLVEALDDLNGGFTVVTDEHAIRLYIVVSQLAVLKNWSDLFNSPRAYANAIPAGFSKQQERERWCGRCRPVWDIFEAELDRLAPETKAATRQWWGDRLGMPQACP